MVERNRPYDTFGWGVVFSDATMDNMRAWDAATADAIEQAFNHWDDIELHFKGRVIRSGGHGFVGIGRKKLLNILQARCEELGVEAGVRDARSTSDADFPDADLIIASDGVNSRIRGTLCRRLQARHRDAAQPLHLARHEQAATTRSPSLFEKTEHGWFQAHIYKFDDKTVDLHRRVPRARVEGARPRQDADQDQLDRLLRAAVRQQPAGRRS